MSEDNVRLFPDLNQVRAKIEGMRGVKFQKDIQVISDLFQFGERHISLYEWTDIVHKCSVTDIGHFVLKSIKCMLSGIALDDGEKESKILTLYSAAKDYVDSNGENGSGKLIDALVTSLEIYKNYAALTPYVLDGIQWHKLAHLALSMGDGIDCERINYEYDSALEEIITRKWR